MTAGGRVVAATSVSAAICLGIGSLIFVPESIDAAEAVAAPAVHAGPSPKPTFGGKKTREGSQITGWSDDHERLGRPGKTAEPPRRKPASSGKARHRTRDDRDVASTTVDEDFRLNKGLCGHPGGNTPALTRCLPAIEDDPPVQPNLPEVTTSMAVAIRIPRPEDVTWDQVMTEVKAVVFPPLTVKVQPAGRTLVNLDTIVYTDKYKVYSQTVTVLGFPVEVQAAPMSYTWSFGDGTTLTTEKPGSPYPSKEITHKYMKKGPVGLRLTVGYEARYNVSGTGWRYIGTVPITGPTTALQVREAVPVLVEPGR